ncbi:MAG: hypothetical protein LBS57_08070 [Treponema sp.]|jgi:hypothetical protein|nr:hypothetical protein [Treponema sp.]
MSTYVCYVKPTSSIGEDPVIGYGEKSLVEKEAKNDIYDFIGGGIVIVSKHRSEEAANNAASRLAKKSGILTVQCMRDFYARVAWER